MNLSMLSKWSCLLLNSLFTWSYSVLQLFACAWPEGYREVLSCRETSGTDRKWEEKLIKMMHFSLAWSRWYNLAYYWIRHHSTFSASIQMDWIPFTSVTSAMYNCILDQTEFFSWWHLGEGQGKDFGLIINIKLCVYIQGYRSFSDADFTESFSQKTPSHKYQFDVKEHKERLITSSDFSIFRYRKDKHAKNNFKKVYKTLSSGQCFDPSSRKRKDFKNDSVMQYKVFCFWVVAAAVMCTILGQWRTLSLCQKY